MVVESITIVVIIIIKHQIKLMPQLGLRLQLEPEFMPQLLHLIVEFQFKLLVRLPPMVIIVEVIKLIEHRLKPMPLLKLVPLIELEHQPVLKLLLQLKLRHQQETHHQPFLLIL